MPLPIEKAHQGKGLSYDFVKMTRFTTWKIPLQKKGVEGAGPQGKESWVVSKWGNNQEKKFQFSKEAHARGGALCAKRVT